MVLSPWRFYSANALDLLGQLACLAAVLCFGVVFSYTKKYVSPYAADPIGIPAAQMVVASLMMLVLAPLFAVGEISLTAPVVVGMLLLGVVSTGLAYVWNFRIIAEWGATAASTVAYVTPLVGWRLARWCSGRKSVGTKRPAAVVIGGIILAQSGPKTTVGATDQAPDGELEEAT